MPERRPKNIPAPSARKRAIVLRTSEGLRDTSARARGGGVLALREEIGAAGPVEEEAAAARGALVARRRARDRAAAVGAGEAAVELGGREVRGAPHAPEGGLDRA